MHTMPDPGVPIYIRTRMPAYLHSYKQLKAAGLRPEHTARPDGAWKVRHGEAIEWRWLYDIRKARPYVCKTKHALSGRKRQAP